MNLRVSRIVTHDTTFHADEVFAVALIKYVGYDVPLMRTRDRVLLAEALEDPTVFVIDVGGVYNPAMLNFDHHQDLSLPSAAGLVYQFLKPVFPETLHAHFDAFFSAIDAVDTNRNNIYALLHTLPEGFRNVSSIISGFNRDVTDRAVQNAQFNVAAKVAFLVIQNENHAALEHARSERNTLSVRFCLTMLPFSRPSIRYGRKKGIIILQ
ncbi:MYG1 family protein [Runella sp.]|uniref:MYG1 family protein n=1 Tax=Runella sp. TaxID=1960881 RepID=UPI003D126AB2